MLPSIDNKKYHQDTRLFENAVVQDGHFKSFTSSPVLDGVPIKDICIYGPGDLNKIGKEGKTSWDSFSYAILMGHNVWHHVNAVQEANRQYDAGKFPAMLIQERFDRLAFRDVINDIFATSNRGEADRLVEDYSKFWLSIIGTRGAVGKKTINAGTKFAELFEVEETPADSQQEHSEEFTEEEITKLDNLENEVK